MNTVKKSTRNESATLHKIPQTFEQQIPKLSKQEINALHTEFQTYGQNAKKWIQKCKMLLPHIQAKEVWRIKGFLNIYEYARILAGMSTNAVDDALWVMKKLEDRPLLKKVAKEKGLNAVRPVLTIVSDNTEKFWAKKANEMSQNTLKTYVQNYREDGPLETENSWVNPSQMPEERIGKSIYMKLNVKTIERLKSVKGERDWDQLLNEMLDIMDATEGGSASNKEIPDAVNTGKRYVPAKIKRYVIEKTSGLCAYPGCTEFYDILHHTKRFVLDSTHDPRTLKPLCKEHEHLAHAGLIENEESSKTIKWGIRMEADVWNNKYEVDRAAHQYYSGIKTRNKSILNA